MMGEALAQVWRRARHGWDYWLGLILAWPSLHKFKIIEREGQRFLHKRRRRLVGLTIGPANQLMRGWRAGQGTGSGAKVLSNREAMAWEREAYRCQGVVLPEPQPSAGICIPFWPGEPLAKVLGDPARDWDDKRKALDLAFTALVRLHRAQARWFDDQIRPLSHSDAMAPNVLIDLDANQARWIDFDMRHDPQLDADWRHADDLRALTFSAAARLKSARFADVVAALARCSDEIPRLTRDRLRDLLETKWRTASAFRAAQAPLSWDDENRLRQMLLAVLVDQPTSVA